MPKLGFKNQLNIFFASLFPTHDLHLQFFFEPTKLKTNQMI